METGSQDQSGKPAAPRIVSGLDAATLARFYPADAEKGGVEGAPVVFKFAVKFALSGAQSSPAPLTPAPPRAQSTE